MTIQGQHGPRLGDHRIAGSARAEAWIWLARRHEGTKKADSSFVSSCLRVMLWSPALFGGAPIIERRSGEGEVLRAEGRKLDVVQRQAVARVEREDHVHALLRRVGHQVTEAGESPALEGDHVTPAGAVGDE